VTADTFGWGVAFAVLAAFLVVVLCALVDNRFLSLGY